MNIFSNIVTNLEISQYSNYDPQIVLKILPKQLFLNARITIIFLQFKKNLKKKKKNARAIILHFLRYLLEK